MIYKGVVTSYNTARGFGWIRPAGERTQDVFFHINYVVDRKPLKIGDSVSFKTTPSPVKPGQLHAVDIVVEMEATDSRKPRRIFDDVPQWFIQAVKKVSPDSHWWRYELPGGEAEESVMAFQDLGFLDSDWFDHGGWCGDVLVSEPYGIDVKGLNILAKLCALMGCTFNITGNSVQLPGRTLRIEIYAPKNDSLVVVNGDDFIGGAL